MSTAGGLAGFRAPVRHPCAPRGNTASVCKARAVARRVGVQAPLPRRIRCRASNGPGKAFREPAKEVQGEVLAPGWRPEQRDVDAQEVWGEEGMEGIDLAELVRGNWDDGSADEDSEGDWLEWNDGAADEESDDEWLEWDSEEEAPEDNVDDEEAVIVDQQLDDEDESDEDDDEEGVLDVKAEDVDEATRRDGRGEVEFDETEAALAGGLDSEDDDDLDEAVDQLTDDDDDDDDDDLSDVSDDDDDDILGGTFLLEMQAELQELKDMCALFQVVSDITASQSGINIDGDERQESDSTGANPDGAAAAEGQSTDADADADAAEDEEADDDLDVRSSILLELAGSTPATLERLLKKYSGMLDEELLELLFRRIQAAQEMREGTEVVDGLIALFKRIRSEVERKASTPALRLLDELLGIMASDAGESEQARINMASETMQRAFSPSGAFGVDIFEMAGALGAGDLEAVDAQTVEYVNRSDFLREVGNLVSGHATSLPARERQLEDMELRIRAGVVKGMYTSAERAILEDKLRVQREKFATTALSVRWAETFLKLADLSEGDT